MKLEVLESFVTPAKLEKSAILHNSGKKAHGDDVIRPCRRFWGAKLVSPDTHKETHFVALRATTAAYVYAHELLRLCFYVVVRYFVVLDIHL